MHSLPSTIIAELTLSAGAPEAALQLLTLFVANEYGAVLPSDYLEFLKFSNGAIGHGPNLFVILDAAERVPSTTQGYAAQEFAPDLLIIGSDGCGNLIGIDTHGQHSVNGCYVWVDSSVIDWQDIKHGAPYLPELLQHLQTYYSQL